MFTTNLEIVENGYVLTVQYKYSIKKWTYSTYEEISILRSKMELYYESNLETLQEVMS